ncbi:GNAT family N-acetyltransferase [Streptacidiphilus sp. ASG 303]|uniref:GNAT family N-acetyltransferase n=1 Tax=Streptacidiphilus sp. ASG 303 TaxID=2896847 RepID=UPI001E4CD13D|nr:GNAT family N-acetyltransferase [Streptacidiphilus sp. ASG 303]MCD0486206.1 GNAT family N-acetyltransferase [Streptacidiphilus sp. ASG 303]
MDHAEVLALFDRQVRRGARPDGPGARVERDGAVVRQVGAEHGWNGVVWSDLDEGTADAAIAAQVRCFSALGREFEWKLYARDRPGDLGARLRAAGFTPEPEETVMVARVRDLPADASLPEGVRLLPVADPAGVDLVVDVHEQAFGADGDRLRRRLLDRLAHSPGTVRMVVAVADGLPVCAARMELEPGTDFAGLWGGGTVPAWRGRGLYRALVAHRARAAAELGYPYLRVDASDRSRPILERLGFVPLDTTTPYVHRPRREDRGR